MKYKFELIALPPAGYDSYNLGITKRTTVGVITELYTAMGGRAAMIQWDIENACKYRDRALLRHLRLVNEPDLGESDASLDVLLS